MSDTSKAPGEEQMAELSRFAEIRLDQDQHSAILETAPPLLHRALVYLITLLVVIGLGVAIFGKIDVVVTAPARIEPEGSTVPVQALQGGVITRVHVAPGQAVQAGAPLLELDPEEAGFALDSLRRRVSQSQEEMARLRAAAALLQSIEVTPTQIQEADIVALTRTGEGVDLVNGLRAAAGQLATAERRQREDLGEKQKLTDLEVGQLRSAMELLRQNLATSEREMATAQRELTARRALYEALADLAKTGNVTRVRLTEAQTAIALAERDLNALVRRQGDTQLELSNKELRITAALSALSDAKRLLEQEVNRTRAGFAQARDVVASHRGRLGVRMADLEAELSRQQDAVKLKEHEVGLLHITARVSGTVTDLAFPAPGARVAAGTKVATIVPDNTPSVILATVPSRDVGFVRPGIEARLKLDAYPFQQFGTVPARVTHVFPIPERPEFRVRLVLLQSFILVDDMQVPVFPGLAGHVDLLTQRERIYRLFLRRALVALHASPPAEPLPPAGTPAAAPAAAPAH